MKKLTSSGAILSAVLASACCILPMVLVGSAASLGIAGFVEGLRPFFLGIAILFLSYGYYVAYFKKKRECEEGEVCATSSGRKRQKHLLWLVTILVIAITTFPYWVQWI